jgi:hypothetical protein
MRQKVRTTVVACPPSVILQWKDELENRFGLNFVVFDRDYVLAKRRERGYGVNPWATHSRFIISHALLRDEAYSGPLRDWLTEFSPSSLLILDEAHNAAPASGARYAIDSAFTRVVREIARRFEHRLFLSATPHNGHSNSFAALLEILDPQRFCRGVPPKNPKVLDEVMVRRLKNDLREIGEDFPVRKVIPVIIDEPKESPEVKLSNLLASYRTARDSRLKDAAKSVQVASGLVTTSLQKRLLSSIEAFALTLAVHRRTFEKRLQEAAPSAEPPVSERDLSLLLSPPSGDDDRADISEDEACRACGRYAGNLRSGAHSRQSKAWSHVSLRYYRAAHCWVSEVAVGRIRCWRHNQQRDCLPKFDSRRSGFVGACPTRRKAASGKRRSRTRPRTY